MKEKNATASCARTFEGAVLNAIAENINFKFYESVNNEFESKLFKAKQIINKIQSNEMAK